MLKKILLVFVAIIVIFVIVVAVQPTNFHVSRSATMAASPAAVFAEVNDLHKWEAWSPWAKMDPKATASYSGAEAGKGAVFRWSGNSDVGEGSMTITESKPDELIEIQLDFIKPFEGTSTVEFTFQPEGDGTLVTWSMSGQNNFVGKAISLFIDCDKIIGDEYEKGLANLKGVVEAKPAAAAEPGAPADSPKPNEPAAP